MSNHRSQAIGLIAGCGAAALVLAGCSSASNDAAQALYDACVNKDADPQLMRLDGASVLIEVTGENAKTLAQAGDAGDALLRGEDISGQASGLAISAGFLIGMECLVDESGFPGTSDQIKDGDSWDGWTFEEESGAGSEFSIRFTSTS